MSLKLPMICVANQVVYRDVNLGDQTIGSGGYLNIASYKPTVSGKTCRLAAIQNWGSSSSTVGVNATGEWLMGTTGNKITNLTIRYYFWQLNYREILHLESVISLLEIFILTCCIFVLGIVVGYSIATNKKIL